MTTYHRKDAKKAGRELKKGDTFYIEADVAENVASYEDGKLLYCYTVTKSDHFLLGGAMVGGQSVEGIIMRDGPAYTKRPAGIRGIWEESPQDAGPLPSGEKYGRPLTNREIRGLEKKFGKKAAEKVAAEAKAAA